MDKNWRGKRDGGKAGNQKSTRATQDGMDEEALMCQEGSQGKHPCRRLHVSDLPHFLGGMDEGRSQD